MSVIKWTTQRRCIFNRILEDNVLCIASPSTADLHEFVRRIAEISSLVQYVTRYLRATRTSLRLKRYFPVRDRFA